MTRPRVSTETEAVNLALARIGSSPIVSLDDDTKRARLAKRAFGPTRDALLRRHPWNFATAWISPVAANGTPPDARFAHTYALTEDVISVLELRDCGADTWAVVSGRGSPPSTSLLVTDETAPQARVVLRRDPAWWDALFVDVFADMLAADLAPGLTDAGGDAHLQRAEAKMVHARRADSREAARGRINRDTSWLAARKGWR